MDNHNAYHSTATSSGGLSWEKTAIGVNGEGVKAYINDIRTRVIEEAVDKLGTAQTELFESFRNNWRGQSEANFEANFKVATAEVQASLRKHMDTLEKKMNAVLNAWMQQDQEMVEKVKFNPFGF